MRASARAAASCSASRRAGGDRDRAPHLAVDLHRDLDRRRRRAARGRAPGSGRTRATPACPSRSHSSSATCGASGASISTSGSHDLARRAPLARCTTWVSRLLSSISARDRGVELELAPCRRATAAIVRCSRRRVSSSAGTSVTCSSPVSSSTTLRQSRWRNRCTPTMSLRAPRPAGVERAHEHLVEPQRVGAVVAVDVVGRDRVLQALAHLPVVADDLGAVVEPRPVALLDLATPRRTTPRSSVNAGRGDRSPG